MTPCAYCHVKPHLDICPNMTGIYPIRPNEFEHGLRCPACDREIPRFYAVAPGGMLEGIPVGTLVCLPCAGLLD